MKSERSNRSFSGFWLKIDVLKYTTRSMWGMGHAVWDDIKFWEIWWDK